MVAVPEELTVRAAAVRLAGELERLGVTADTHDGYGMAVLMVWVDLVVWVDGGYFRWWSGRTSSRGRYVWAFGAVGAPDTAARRIARRYVELRADHPLSAVIAETLGERRRS